MKTEPPSTSTDHGSCSHCTVDPEKNRPGPPAVRYTGPMHPEVIAERPGACPICGMALEQVAPGRVADDPAELNDLTRRFWIGALLSLPVFLLAMGEMTPGLRQIVEGIGERASLLIQFALS